MRQNVHFFKFLCCFVLFSWLNHPIITPVSSQIKQMNTYLTVPAAAPDSPTMRRARLASGKYIHLSQMQTLGGFYLSCLHLNQ